MDTEFFGLLLIKNVSSALNCNYHRQSMCTGIERLLTHKRASLFKSLSLQDNCMLSFSQ